MKNIIYNPNESIDSNKTIRIDNYITTTRYGFNYNIDRLVCTMIIDIEKPLQETISRACAVNTPLAILTKLANCNEILNQVNNSKYINKNKHTLIHINGNTMLENQIVDEAYCWILFNFITPAEEMIAITPSHFMLSKI